MYMRLVEVKVKPDSTSRFQQLYNEKILPVLQQTPGCIYAALIMRQNSLEDCISMTLWDSLEHVEAYTQTSFQKLLEESRPYLSDSSEWKIQLSKDHTLEYAPVPEDPVVTSYNVATPVEEKLSLDQESLYVRLTSMKIRPEKKEEFLKIYQNDILPALHKVAGCRYAYLNANMKADNEFISVTVWDSKKAADEYERSGMFDQLVGKLKHTFTGLFQWKMELDKSRREKSVTSDDVKVGEYAVVTGKVFK